MYSMCGSVSARCQPGGRCDNWTALALQRQGNSKSCYLWLSVHWTSVRALLVSTLWTGGSMFTMFMSVQVLW